MLYDLLMFKNRDLFFLSNFVEIIHIQLSHKRWKFFMFKILRKNLIFKKIFILDNKATSSLSPLDNMWIPPILKNLVSFHDEIRYFLSSMNSFFTTIILWSLIVFWLFFWTFFFFKSYAILWWNWVFLHLIIPIKNLI